MRINVQYIPLEKLKPDFNGKMTRSIKKLRNVLWDSANLLAVRKNRKDGTYIIVAGLDRYHYLRKHTKAKSAPCIVDSKHESPLLEKFPCLRPKRITPAGWSIIRTFLKQEPRFRTLSPLQQAKVLYLGVRFKKTVIRSMKLSVDEFIKKKEQR
ncbi:hypothetical protein [Paenibacillus alkalitolerans]|uniref:hypothetical protein n=1 Tax=Paenibacillus alkalitolerans TaxID=2799335 RepID=UPI0018F344F1|nr:hypothetical protein [Paenibacillus alkalitolerans]